MRLAKNTITRDEFGRKSLNDQVAHVDITIAPTFRDWAKASRTAQRRKRGYDRGDAAELRATRWDERRKDLNALGFDMVFTGGKSSEYAYQVCRELGITPILNQGIYKGCAWDVDDLYARLPED